MFVDVNASSYSLSSADEKTDKLRKKYGDKIFGLSKESKSEEYIPLYLQPALQKIWLLQTENTFRYGMSGMFTQ
jgi:hypothetical protein